VGGGENASCFSYPNDELILCQIRDAAMTGVLALVLSLSSPSFATDNPCAESDPCEDATHQADHTVTTSVQAGQDQPSWDELETRLMATNRVYFVGGTMYLAGGGIAGAGALVGLVGMVRAIMGQDETMLDVGLYMMVVGAGVAVLGIPVALAGSTMGVAQLQNHGIHVKIWPSGVAFVGFVVTAVGVGLVPYVGILPSTAGAFITMAAGGYQVSLSNKSMHKFRSQSDLSLRILPSVSPRHTGLALSGRF
jgi:hypothetical protein